MVSGRWSVVRRRIYRIFITFLDSPFTKMWHVPHLRYPGFCRAEMALRERAFSIRGTRFCRFVARLEGVKKWPHFGPKRHLLNPRRPLLRRIHTTHASTAYPTRFRGVSHVLDDTQPTPIDLAPGGFTDNVSFFVNVVFPQAGTYWVQTLCDQHVMEEFPLIVADQGSVSTMQPPDQVSETIN